MNWISCVLGCIYLVKQFPTLLHRLRVPPKDNTLETPAIEFSYSFTFSTSTHGHDICSYFIIFYFCVCNISTWCPCSLVSTNFLALMPPQLSCKAGFIHTVFRVFASLTKNWWDTSQKLLSHSHFTIKMDWWSPPHCVSILQMCIHSDPRMAFPSLCFHKALCIPLSKDIPFLYCLGPCEQQAPVLSGLWLLHSVSAE